MRKSRRPAPAPAQLQKKTPRQPWQWIVIGMVLLLTVGVYAQVFSAKFLFIDDPEYVTGNGYVRGGLTAQDISWAFTTHHASNWHPLTWISHMLDCQLFGLNPAGHHLVSLFWHLAATFLLFIVLRRATGAAGRSAFVAGLFALHPLHVESVAWVAERKDVLSTFLWMLTMLAYVFYTEQPRLRRYLLVCIAFALGLMAKPMLVSLPIALLLLDYWPLKRSEAGWKRLILEKIPLFALSLASCIITSVAQHLGGAMQELSDYPLTVRIANAVVAYCAYLKNMIAPINIGPLYPHPGVTIPTVDVIISTVILLCLTAAALASARKKPYLTVGWLFYVLTLVPVIGIVQVGQQAMADRYTYVPLIGIFVAIAWTIPELLRSSRLKLALAPAGAIIILVLSFLTLHQARAWRDSGSFVRQMLTATCNHPLSRALEAKYLVHVGKVQEAEKEMAALVREYPRLPEARVAHAWTLNAVGKLGDDEKELREAIRLRPTYAEAYTNLGVLCDSNGNPQLALTYCRKAVELRPANAMWRSNLAHVYATAGRIDEAVAEYEKAVAIAPDLAASQRDLGVMLSRQQDSEGAIEHLKLAVTMAPDDAISRWILGVLLQRAGYNNQAIEQLEVAVKLKPKWGSAHGALAMALDGAGLNDQALKELALAKKYGANTGLIPAGQ